MRDWVGWVAVAVAVAVAVVVAVVVAVAPPRVAGR